MDYKVILVPEEIWLKYHKFLNLKERFCVTELDDRTPKIRSLIFRNRIALVPYEDVDFTKPNPEIIFKAIKWDDVKWLIENLDV